MAKKPNILKVNQWMKNIQSGMDQLYKNTYYSDKTNITDMNTIVDGIQSDISSIINRNKEMDISGISKLYSKAQLSNALNDKQLVNNVKELFDENPLTDELLSTYIGNKWIKELDAEIDTVLKYCTKMGEALDLIRDAVLSSDSFSKDFINPESPFSGDDDATSIFQSRTDAIIKKYDLQKKVQDWYDEASRHGEQYVYVVPYKKAISKLLNNRSSQNSDKILKTVLCSVSESAISGNSAYTLNEENVEGDMNVKIIFDKSYTLQSAIDTAKVSHSYLEKSQGISLMEQFINENDVSFTEGALDISIPDGLEIPKELDDRTSVDGFIRRTSKNPDMVSPNELKIKGSVIKTLQRSNLLPLYIEDDICFGYYYLEVEQEMDTETMYSTSNSSIHATGRFSKNLDNGTMSYENQQRQLDDIIMKLSANISVQINKQFVNSNQDLTKEIYAILKSNEIFNSKYRYNTVRISFLPAEDVHRLAFNVDPETHRGISDCMKGLIPAKLFSCLYISDVLGILTRGQDKRVYYVKQTVDTNISQTLLTVLNQIKKSNFNIRQIENINSILNITGRFNDYIIPVGQTGDSPIQFEVMPGQQIEPKTELMNTLEEMAVNSTNCTIELVQSRMSPDFATQITSSSLKVLRFVYARQMIVQKFIGGILTKIYNYEYEDSTNGYIEIDVELPPPMVLNLTNSSQLIQNAQEQANLLAELEYGGDTSQNVDQKKAIFIRKYVRWTLSAYIKSSTIDKIKALTEMELQVTSPPEEENNEEM